jgi:hypothetical protein
MRTLCLLLLLALAACSAPTPVQPTPDACMGKEEKDGGIGGTGHDEALCPDNAD